MKISFKKHRPAGNGFSLHIRNESGKKTTPHGQPPQNNCVFLQELRPLMNDKEIDLSNPEFQTALKLVQYTHQSVFLTGKAGTGKSTFLRYICEHTKKKHIVLAPTGIAAINAGGSTLHSFFKLPFYPLLPDDPKFSVRRIKDFLKYNSSQQKIIKEVELIIIDEISMVRADIIDFIDKVLRIYSRNMGQPFGGKQLLLVGDIYQLEPVIKSDEREILNRFYPNPFFFSAHVFREMELVSVELCKVYRQTDPVFVGVLNRIRNNTAGTADLQLLNTRVNPDREQKPEEMYITLATRRDQADYINEKRLDELPGSPIVFVGEVKGEFPASSLPTSMELSLKPGAQVIFVKNDMDKRWVNGTIGMVTEIDEQAKVVHVITDTGKEFDVQQEVWSNLRYTYNEKEKKIEEEELGTFTQFPLRLAWAITVHKSQGLTFKNMVIDFTGGVFAGGQTYVALSRCASLDGITLKKAVSRGDIFVRPEIVHFAQQFNNPEMVEKAMKSARADMLYVEAVNLFDKGEFKPFLDTFFKAIHTRYDIEKPLMKRFIRRKLEKMNTLRDENRRLKEQMQRQRKDLEKYAQEYYRMGNDCITLAHDAKAAIANFDKAIELYPTFVDAWVRKGVTLHNEKLYTEAASCFNEAVRLSPASFKARYNRGKNRLAMNDVEGALTDLDRATSFNPEHAGAHELFGEALSRLGKTDEAALQWDIADRLRKNKRKNKK